ncbi:MAG: ABC transporter permease [Candidatus Solibacter usitatus]|nr:ABC transporter permease [Candidatus Solibacter usitatus]
MIRSTAMGWMQDLRFAARMIRSHPWFTLAIVATMALGIGVNTTIFTLVNSVLWKPLPFPGGERLVLLAGTNVNAGNQQTRMAMDEYRQLRDHTQVFESLEAYAGEPMALSEPGKPPERYRGALISAGLFQMLEAKPILGRALSVEDEKAGAQPALLIGYAVWRDRFGKDPSVAGRVVRLNQKAVTIAGVMPEGFKFPSNEDMWLALQSDAKWEKRDFWRLQPIGKLKPGVSLAESRASAETIARNLETTYPATNRDRRFKVMTFHEAMNGGSIRQVFLLLMGAVGFVLLIACANVANMLLSRAAGRTREISIRTALGAGRWRVVRQMLTESLLFSVIGGSLGLLLAMWGIDAFSKAVSNVGKPYWVDFAMNYTVFAYFGGVCVLSAILFGLIPALQVSRTNVYETLKEGARGSDGVRGGFVSGALVVFQFTLALVLLSGAGLMMRSFLEHQNVFRHIPAERILHARISLPAERYAKPEDRIRFVDRVLERLSALPGVEAAALTTSVPGTGGDGFPIEIEGRPLPEGTKRPMATGVVASPGYLAMLHQPILLGRDFTNTDGLPGKESAIVTQRFSSRFWPGANPIGQRLRIVREGRPPGPWLTVTGVTADIAQDVFEQDPAPVMFTAYRQEGGAGFALLVGASVPTALAASVRGELQKLDEDLTLFDVQSLIELFARNRWQWRVFGTLFVIFAWIALVMASVGIYAVIAQAASRRTREIGIRIALGANSGEVLRLVMRRGLIQLGIALGVGLPAAFGVCRLMRGILFGVSTADPLTFCTVAFALTAAGSIACWLPARRAVRLDPVQALRYE